jgi:hypothetical protein
VLDRLTMNGRLLPRGATYALAAVAVAFLTPDARAGCGDYVHIAATNAAAVTDSVPPPPSPQPCHGPSCQRAPDRAPLAPVAPAVPTVDKAACPAPDLDLPAGEEPVFTHLPPPLSAGRPYRPERPPRA